MALSGSAGGGYRGPPRPFFGGYTWPATPHGSSTIAAKSHETSDSCTRGATEIDVVVNIGKVLSHDWAYVRGELGEIRKVTSESGSILKVIFETDYLGDEEVIALCEICSDLSVDFVKTSTGFGFVKQSNGMYAYEGATPHFLKLMREHSKPEVQVKASGAVRTLSALLHAYRLCVTRVGATATRAIVDEAKALIAEGKDLDGMVTDSSQMGGGY